MHYSSSTPPSPQLALEGSHVPPVFGDNPHARLEADLDSLVVKIGQSVEPSARLYFSGLGMDFDEFALPLLIPYENKLAGVACLWTRPARHGLACGLRLIDLTWQYVEESTAKGPVLVLCHSIIADEMEIVTAISLLHQQIAPSKILIVSRAANSRVVRHLKMLGKQFRTEIDVTPLVGDILRKDLRPIRDAWAERFDVRADKSAPRLSKWLANRAFGPEPEPENKIVADGTRKPGG